MQMYLTPQLRYNVVKKENYTVRVLEQLYSNEDGSVLDWRPVPIVNEEETEESGEN